MLGKEPRDNLADCLVGWMDRQRVRFCCQILGRGEMSADLAFFYWCKFDQQPSGILYVHSLSITNLEASREESRQVAVVTRSSSPANYSPFREIHVATVGICNVVTCGQQLR